MSEPRDPRDPEKNKERDFFSRTGHNFFDPLGHGLARAVSRVPLIGPVLVTIGHIFADIAGSILHRVSQAAWKITKTVFKTAVSAAYGLHNNVLKPAAKWANKKVLSPVGSFVSTPFRKLYQWGSNKINARRDRINEENRRMVEADRQAEEEAHLEDVPDVDVIRGNGPAAEVNAQQPAEEEIPDFDELIEDEPVQAQNAAHAQNNPNAEQNPNGNANENNPRARHNRVVPGTLVHPIDAKDTYKPGENEPLAEVVKHTLPQHPERNETEQRMIGAMESKALMNVDIPNGMWNKITTAMYYRILDHRMQIDRRLDGQPGALEKTLRKDSGRELVKISQETRSIIKAQILKQLKLIHEQIQAQNAQGHSMTDADVRDLVKPILENNGTSEFKAMELAVFKNVRAEKQAEKARKAMQREPELQNSNHRGSFRVQRNNGLQNPDQNLRRDSIVQRNNDRQNPNHRRNSIDAVNRSHQNPQNPQVQQLGRH